MMTMAIIKVRPSCRRFAWLCFTAILTLVAFKGVARAQTPDSVATLARQSRLPVALVCRGDGKTLIVANARSGSLSVVDTRARRVVAESEVGRGLADLAIVPGGQRLLAVDRSANEVLLIATNGSSVRAVDRIAVSPDPTHIVAAANGLWVVVASQWSRRLSFIDLSKRAPTDEQPRMSLAGSLDLPFCPRQMVCVNDGSKLIVADAFGGQLAVVDVRRRALESVRTLPAHNIRGLAFTPDGQDLVIAHQVLNRLAQTGFDDVHWGLLIRNHIRVVRTDALLASQSDASLVGASRLFDLGDVGYAAGDPDAVAFDRRGNMIVALAGVDEIGISAGAEQAPRRVAVGRRPTALAPSPDGELVYIANLLDDTISVIKVSTGQNLATIPLGPRPDLTAIDRGERLFFGAKLSHDGWMSCHSCHTDGHTNNLVSDTLGDSSFGAPKRVPSLLGVAATGPWTWTGSMARLDEQVRKSVATTMHGSKPTDEQVADLTAYLGSLKPPSSTATGFGRGESSAEARGRGIFEVRKCATCHIRPEYTSAERFDVGLKDEVGNHEFNPPSLRGVGSRDAFLHDGRSRSLEDVFQRERHPRGLEMTRREVGDLIAFLRTL
jgi:YVTN family beta-propeller protein